MSYILGIIKYIYLKCAVHWILTNVCSLSASSQDIENFFTSKISLTDILSKICMFFCEMTVRFFAHLRNGLLSSYWVASVLCIYSGHKYFVRYVYCENFFLVVWDLTFLFLNTVSWKIKALSLLKFNSYFSLTASTFLSCLSNLLADPQKCWHSQHWLVLPCPAGSPVSGHRLALWAPSSGGWPST